MNTFVRLAILAIAVLGMTQKVSAQAATQNINLSATVAEYCSIDGLAIGATTPSRVIPVASGTVNTAALTQVSIADVACSKATDVTIATTNTGLTTGGTAGAGFQDVIHYTASAAFNGAAPSITTNTTTTDTDATAGAAAGTLTVDITPIANASPLIAGGYADVLVVTLTPQP